MPEQRRPDRTAALSTGRLRVSAPGRANLMGEHTDVNDGFVLPVALELSTVVSGHHADRDVLVLASRQYPDEAIVEVDLGTGRGPTTGWGRYATAVVAVLREAGLEMSGLEGSIDSDVPLGAGLSSSAALEVALALALLREPIEPLALAQLCQRAENGHVGVQSGIMDQYASAGAREGAAMLLDCRDLTVRHVPVPDSLAVLVVDSGVQRSLDGSAYNERREQCTAAAGAMGVDSLRDVSLANLEQAWDGLDDVLRRRARHVVTENARVFATAEALQENDEAALGELMAASHASLRDDFEVSAPELDELVAIAVATPGVLGSRLTGAGFGGCTVTLVRTELAQQTRQRVIEQYARSTGRAARAWVSRPAAGAVAALAASGQDVS